MKELKAILASKRANLYYLEHCRVMQKDGRVLYFTEAKKENLYFNIPIANTTVILLGTGTSITQAAVRMLASAGVIVGFCGGSGTPLLMATEVEWFTPQSEYRPTEYIQGWMYFWFNPALRLAIGIQFQEARLSFLKSIWGRDKDFQTEGLNIDSPTLLPALERFENKTQQAISSTDLLLIEAELTRALYRYVATQTGNNNFSRQRDSTDKANAFLNHGNYLAYGLAATTLWVLGIPHGFAVMHGKTRRGALVFDVADLIKDALVLPLSFICAKENASDQEFRQQCIQYFIKYKALDFMFEQVKEAAMKYFTSDMNNI